MSSSYDSNKYVKGYRLGMERNPEEILRERIRLWRDGRLQSGHQQVFSFHGKPGVGKSWLLLDIKEDKKYVDAVYINLLDRKKITASQFIHDVEKAMPQGRAPMMQLMLVDHVPETRDDTLKLFEEQIIKPYYEGGSLFVFAQHHPRNWCWVSAIPHPPAPFTLYGFNDKGKKELFKKYKLATTVKGKLFEFQETLPLFVAFKSQVPDDGILAEEYLKYWLLQIDPPAVKEFDKEMTLIGALSWLPSLADVESMIEIIKLVGRDDSYLNVLARLGRWQWITPLDAWEEPVRTLLNLWLQQQKPALAKTLDEKYRS